MNNTPIRHIFKLAYRTSAGERLFVSFSGSVRIPMSSPDGEHWTATYDLEQPSTSYPLRYIYQVIDDEGNIVASEHESHPRTLSVNGAEEVCLQDFWDNVPIEPVLFRAPFRNIFQKPQHPSLERGKYQLRLRAFPAPKGKYWAVSGDCSALGNWNVGLPLQQIEPFCFQWECPLEQMPPRFAYKFQLVEEDNPTNVIWEEGENRVCELPEALSVIHTDIAPKLHVEPWRGSGVVVPVFSLRSKGSFGIGDFGDLRFLVDWAAGVGMRVIQLLPINDTTSSGTWHDSYPYNCVSVFALHPIYLDLRQWAGMPLYTQFEEEGERLNRYLQVDYEQVFQLKMKFLTALYAEQKGTLQHNAKYRQFKAENASWLPAYAAFSALRGKFRTSNFYAWKGFETYHAEVIDKLLQSDVDFASAVEFHEYVQFLLAQQMEEAHAYAAAHGILLKGDIPIGVSPHSVDCWTEPHLFFTNAGAGAPPDDFAVNGQNWGFPTYNWEAMSKDGYAWWRKRFSSMSKYFDAYRIDHVLGFFRIWEIPVTQYYGVLGYFRPALPLGEEELRAAGFMLSPSELCRPHIAAKDLQKMERDGANRKIALSSYLESSADGSVYYLKADYATQRDIAEKVEDALVREALMEIAANVLFIEDGQQPNTYHPRIVAYKTPAYAHLDAQNRAAFDALYEDFFYHRHDAFWKHEALKKMPTLVNTNDMIACAEDLGMVADCVKDVLAQLHILSLEIQRMPKTMGVQFSDLRRNPYLSVATIATHDMPPLQKWWEENPSARQNFWREVLGRAGEAPEKADCDVCRTVLEQHLASPSIFCLLSIQNWLSIDENLRSLHPEEEQINDPANPNQNWNYRMRTQLEQLISATAFNERVRGMIAISGR